MLELYYSLFDHLPSYTKFSSSKNENRSYYQLAVNNIKLQIILETKRYDYNLYLCSSLFCFSRKSKRNGSISFLLGFIREARRWSARFIWWIDLASYVAVGQVYRVFI